MYEKFFEQTQNAMKPFSDLMTLNAKILEEAAEKQKNFFSDWINDSMSFAKELSSQKDYSGVYQTQKAYVESLQEKWIAASTEAYESFTANQEKVSKAIKSASTVA